MSVWRPNSPPTMTPQQAAIIDVLRGAGGWINASTIRDAIGSTATAASIRVQMCKLRTALGDKLELESETGPGARGYRLVRCEA